MKVPFQRITHIQNNDDHAAISNATWEDLDLSSSIRNFSVCEFIIENSSESSKTVGMREWGSGVERKVTIGANSSIYMSTQVDVDSILEVYAETYADINFKLISNWCA